ncbi:hypothetical protein [Amycolatopsis suaedae]|uniref:Uncharacterized protein n=1 Tax=Amycolatopsis suaedae TaxID=2510978 RepID=A0A4Q7J2C8_9PSEU|nr:hypothetical protein [Amycolatopsis suaedae]RZQ61047.1 hypothetical protein EWH70_26690 [Amycolatopsis suaedae]
MRSSAAFARCCDSCWPGAAAGADLLLAPTIGFLGAHLGVLDVQFRFQFSVPTRAFPDPLLPAAGASALADGG